MGKVERDEVRLRVWQRDSKSIEKQKDIWRFDGGQVNE